MTARRAEEPTYSLGAVARLTGVSPATLRAWERRYEAVKPLRTDGGTRRYREGDVARLRLLKAAVEAGHRIGDVADLGDEELRTRGAQPDRTPRPPLEEILAAFERLDALAAEDLLAFQLSALGPIRFVNEIAYPLLAAIGTGWESQKISIAAEHLATSLLRSFLGAALRPSLRGSGLRVVFGTPPGEKHELGLLAAALGAVSVGVEPVYLGPDLPTQELVRAVDITEASALALSLVSCDPAQGREALRALRQAIPDTVEIWVGGTSAAGMDLPDGVTLVTTLQAIEERVALLRARGH